MSVEIEELKDDSNEVDVRDWPFHFVDVETGLPLPSM